MLYVRIFKQFVLVLIAIQGCLYASPVAFNARPLQKPRVIASTDGEVDDRSSMVRFLLYASDYDVIGFIQNNSIFQKRGHSRDGWLEREIELYGEVYPNLKQHHPDYPSPEYLKGIITIGNENRADLHRAPADMETKDTPGSDLIIATLLDDDPRPVHVPCWGGANTVAFALWKLKTTQPDRFAAAAARLRVYGITYNLSNKAQDGGYLWIIQNMPEVKIYTAATWAGTYSYDSIDGKRGRPSKNPQDIQQYFNDSWLTENIKTNHGPLGAYYPQSYTSEGDTPSFLPLIDNGLGGHLDYTLGGWGGRAQIKSGNHMVDALDEDPDKWAAVYRWSITAQNDFAARADWCVAVDYTDANHNPKARVAGSLARTVVPGTTIRLDATATTDPDGDKLTFTWWQYHEVDSVGAKVTIKNANSKQASFVVPDEPGKQLHIILEVTDDGSPSLTHYQRLIMTIGH
jgi:hypothetical protein